MSTSLNTPRDLNETLAEGLAAIESWESAERGSDAEYQAAEAATRCLAEIDAALRDKGRLPDSWGYALRPWKVLVEHADLPPAVQAAARMRSCGDPECHNPDHLITTP